MSSTTKNVAVIVVTYNRLELLKKCIEAIQHQTLKNFDIIVVNNGSTDGTAEWLSNQKSLIVITQKNLGGSGGFHNGIKYAFKHGYEYFWIMDDDGLPESECLEKLLNVSKKGFNYVAPNLMTFDNKPHFKSIDSSAENILNHIGGPFNAILLSRNLIAHIGLPNKYYFIWGDEYEFTNRVKEQFFFTALVKDAIHHHKITEENPKAVENRIYYKVRNMIWNVRLMNGIIESKKYKNLQTLSFIIRYFFKYLANLKIKPLRNLSRGVIDGYSMNLEILKSGSYLEDIINE